MKVFTGRLLINSKIYYQTLCLTIAFNIVPAFAFQNRMEYSLLICDSNRITDMELRITYDII